MREVILSNGNSLMIRPLSVKAVRELRQAARDGLDDIFATVAAAGVDLASLDDLPFTDLIAVNKAIIAETYGLEDETKN